MLARKSSSRKCNRKSPFRALNCSKFSPAARILPARFARQVRTGFSPWYMISLHLPGTYLTVIYGTAKQGTRAPSPRPGGRSRTCSAKPHAAVPAAAQRLERTVIRQHGSDSRGQMSDDFSTFDFERTDLRVSPYVCAASCLAQFMPE